MRVVASGHGTGIKGTGRAANHGRRVILWPANPIGIDAEPNITVAGMFSSG